jgi:hypothetical protein
MMATAVDGSSNLIPYEYYLNQLMVIIELKHNCYLLVSKESVSQYVFFISQLEQRAAHKLCRFVVQFLTCDEHFAQRILMFSTSFC